MESIILRCVEGILGLFGLFLVGAGFLTTWQLLKTSRYPTAPGSILRSGVEERAETVHRSDEGSVQTHKGYLVTVEYRYTAEGREYTGNTLSAVEKTGTRRRMNKIAAAYPPGAVVQVHYNPKNPAESFLKASSPLTGLIFLLAGAALLAAAAWMAFHS